MKIVSLRPKLLDRLLLARRRVRRRIGIRPPRPRRLVHVAQLPPPVRIHAQVFGQRCHAKPAFSKLPFVPRDRLERHGRHILELEAGHSHRLAKLTGREQGKRTRLLRVRSGLQRSGTRGTSARDEKVEEARSQPVSPLPWAHDQVHPVLHRLNAPQRQVGRQRSVGCRHDPTVGVVRPVPPLRFVRAVWVRLGEESSGRPDVRDGQACRVHVGRVDGVGNQIRAGFATVRSLWMFPVFSVPAGSKRMTSTS